MRVITSIIAVILATAACGRRAVIPDHGAGGSPARADSSFVADDKAPTVRRRVEYAVVSDIPDCLTVAGKDTKEEENLLLARVETKVTRITSECGCTWKGLLTRSIAGPSGLEAELASGTLFAPEPNGPAVERLVVLLGDRAHPPKDRPVLHVGCAPSP